MMMTNFLGLSQLIFQWHLSLPPLISPLSHSHTDIQILTLRVMGITPLSRLGLICLLVQARLQLLDLTWKGMYLISFKEVSHQMLPMVPRANLVLVQARISLALAAPPSLLVAQWRSSCQI